MLKIKREISMHSLKLWLISLILLPYSAWSESSEVKIKVFEKEGNIYYTTSSGKPIQITHAKKDHSPILSPDQKFIAFTRTTNFITPEDCLIFDITEDNHPQQIWIYNINGKVEKLLIDNSFSCDKPEKKITDPTDLKFSPDSKTLYFLTSAWATSGALHAINLNGTNQRFLMPANSINIVPAGYYQGYLLVQQHRYFIGGGSFDWIWLFSPNGKEEGPVGEELTQDQKEYFHLSP